MIEIYSLILVDRSVAKKEERTVLIHVQRDAIRVNASLAILKVHQSIASAGSPKELSNAVRNVRFSSVARNVRKF